jgi:hypothetical protein
MKINNRISILVGVAVLLTNITFAGNKDRVGQAGAGELLINPYARSTGWGGANTASAIGLEATQLNVAGLAFTNKTELIFARTNWFSGSGININTFGLSQKLGENKGVLGISVMSMNFGDIEVTTVDNPEGGLGTFSPKILTFALSYAKEFSNSISGGFTVKSINESISNARASGMAIDLGVRYTTGENDRVKFGIALRNVGPKMQFRGDGFSFKTVIDSEEYTLEQRTEAFELPSLLNIGASYDIYLAATTDSTGKSSVTQHRVTIAGNFTANSFGKDQIRAGLEYGYKNTLMLRAGYVYEAGLNNPDTRTTFNVGPTAGLTFEVPMGSSGSTFGLDYSYRVTRPMSGTHAIGVRINL